MRKEILGASRVLMYLFIHSFFLLGSLCLFMCLSVLLGVCRFLCLSRVFLSVVICTPHLFLCLPVSLSPILPSSHPLPSLPSPSSSQPSSIFFFLPPVFLSLLLPLILLSPSPSSSLRTNRVSKRDNGNY